MSKHATLAPSAGNIWVRCPAQVKHALAYGREYEGTEPDEGKTAHVVATDAVKRFGNKGKSVITQHKVGDIIHNVPVTQEMLDGAQVFAGQCIAQMKDHGYRPTDPHVGVEKRVSCHDIHEECWGTPDFYLIADQARTVYVTDYKFGFVDRPPVLDYQLMIYACGVWYQVQSFHVEHNIEDWTFELSTAQPRNFHGHGGAIRSWRVTGAELKEEMELFRNAAVLALNSPTPVFRTGAHCLYCEARHACAAATEAGAKLFESAIAPWPVDDYISPRSMGLRLTLIHRAQEQLKSLQTGLEAEIAANLRSGKPVQGWTMEHSYGRTVWRGENKEIIALGKSLKINLTKPDAIITPKQAVDAGMDPDVADAMSHKPRRGSKLVPHQSIKYAKEVFSK